ncbi:MAG: hypothetical protein KAX65_04135 [Caldilineaceae bacterium]|nr:hypothetical protein [Caldilineaceae bacterium]
MPERASIFEIVQFGAESAPGSIAVADSKLLSLTLTAQPKVGINTYTGRGAKFPVTTALNKEWVEASVTGPMTYTDIAYILNGLLCLVSPTGASTGKTWVHAPDSDGPDTVQTYTVEGGSSVRATRFLHGLFTGATFNFTRDECTVDASMIGQALIDGATLTPNPVDVALVPLTATQVAVSVSDTQASLAGAAALTRVLSCSWGLTNKAGPVWAMPSTGVTSSFAAFVESAPEIRVKLLMEADAAGMGLLTQARANTTKWLRIKATSTAVVEGATPYSLTIDTPLRVAGDFPFSDKDGVYAVEWDLVGVHDGTWGKACEVTLVTTVAAL